MLISEAHAQTSEIAVPAQPVPPVDPMNGFFMNMGLILILVVMFYVLLIRPQQKRFKEHAQLLSELKKGDKVVTGGGLIGKIDKIVNDNEMVLDLGGVKITVLRSTLQGKYHGDAKSADNDKKADSKAVNKK